MTDIVTPEQLQNASLDATALQTFINGSDSEDVLTRLSQQYPTLAKALKILMQTGGWSFYATATELLAAKPAVVPSVAYAADTKKLYKWDGANWIDEGLSQLDLAKQYIDRLISTDTTDEGLLFVGDDGFIVGSCEKDKLELRGLITIENSDDTVLAFIGNDHFEVGALPHPPTSSGTAIEGLEVSAGESIVVDDVFSVKNSDDTKLIVVGSDHFEVGVIAPEAVVDDETETTPISLTTPLFYGQPLCAFAGKPFIINVPSLISERQKQAQTTQVIATISSQLQPFSISSRDQIYIPDLSQIGNGYITLRDTTAYTISRTLFTAKTAATIGKSAVAPKVLMIGDSITNRELITIVKNYLTSYSYSPKMVGTLNSSAIGEVSTSGTGELGEGREGWESGDYTYLITDRAKIVEQGSEATYLALDKATKKEYNPFLRASTTGDDSSIIRNGYVLDFANYQSRFSLETPDIVVIQLGTNDIRDRDEPTLSAQFYSEMTLLIQRIRVAWVNAKIILSLPNTSADVDRDALWQNEYTPVIRKLMQIRSDFSSDGKVFLCPSWALSTSEAGYSITTASSTTDSLTGAQIGTLADNIHPQFAARYQLAHVLAAYIACAADNLI